jgi:hypothetical protein
MVCACLLGDDLNIVYFAINKLQNIIIGRESGLEARLVLEYPLNFQVAFVYRDGGDGPAVHLLDEIVELELES